MNIYILTEEKPKIEVIQTLLNIYTDQANAKIEKVKDYKIEPIFEDQKFSFTYSFEGARIEDIDKIYIKLVSGSSSFTDFLFYVQEEEPAEGNLDDNLMFAVEETKTSDDESRNTGVYQRASKFIFIKAYYNTPLYMLYNDELELRLNKKPSDTSIFGTNMLLTLGIKVLGKPIEKWFKPFETIDEMINFKNGMRRPPKGNTPILFKKTNDAIYVSGRLDKPKSIGKISHDPNIGALSIIAGCLRELGWESDIIVTNHNITQEYIDESNGKNKFLYITKLLNIKMDGLILPTENFVPDTYWHYEKKSEKVASILFHIMYENKGYKEVYQNHAGCERGYFKNRKGKLIVIPKKNDDDDNILIPDVIMRDDVNKKILLIEGKQLSTIAAGLKEIGGYDDIIELFIKRYYGDYIIEKRLTIFGGKKKELPHDSVILYVNEYGEIYE